MPFTSLNSEPGMAPLLDLRRFVSQLPIFQELVGTVSAPASEATCAARVHLQQQRNDAGDSAASPLPTPFAVARHALPIHFVSGGWANQQLFVDFWQSRFSGLTQEQIDDARQRSTMELTVEDLLLRNAFKFAQQLAERGHVYYSPNDGGPIVESTSIVAWGGDPDDVTAPYRVAVVKIETPRLS